MMPKPKRPPRYGSKKYDEVIRDNERYGNDPVWLGPRGRDYTTMLDDPKPYQIANLYPDPNSSYWIGQFALPEGATLILKGRFPHCRYTELALYRPDPLGSFTATPEALTDDEIEPDEGSVNPFVPGNSRLAENRSYTIRVVAKDAPADDKDREPNTLYAGTQGLLQMCLRVYLPDIGRDATGDVGLPGYEGIAANGTPLPAEEVLAQWNQPMSEGIKSGMTLDQWKQLREAPDNDPAMKPESIPSREPPVLERFFNSKYNFVGVFKPPEVRAKIPHQVETGFGGSSNITYVLSWVSRAFGEVLVLRGKLPKYPDTFAGGSGKGLETMTDWEARYWSLVICEAPPSGLSNDGLSDFQVPLDEEGNYTIVLSREEDRPANATEDNGVAWMEWSSRGEGLDDPSNRPDFGMLVFRYQHTNPEWQQSPTKVAEPGTETEVMGPYCPRGEYMDKATFEAKGVKR
jgi:hypothetical protein